MTHFDSTAALLAAIATGDETAFERLFRAWYGRLADHALRMTRDRDRAEDAVQEVFVALWNGRDRLPEPAALAGYLHRAVRNRALNQLRATKGDRVDPDGLAALAVAPTALRSLESEELGRAVVAALEALPPRTREIFLLSREQGLTYREIAATLEISVKTVETLMGRALRELRAVLGDERR
jgi:RNA polymerase sigma-70 factor (ECF subfamily)